MEDVIIIGGGPAGSALGSYLSLAGLKSTIIESAHHPRPHVGESLVTSTTRIFNEIDFLSTMELEGFVRKYGAAWHPPDNLGEFAIKFREFPQEGIAQAYTYHVDRSKFDLALLKHAEILGVKIYQGVRVNQVLFENDQATGVNFNIGSRTVSMKSRVIVDASGRQTLLGRQLKIKKKDPIFNQFAMHAWFEGVDRGSGETADYIHIYFLPVDRGWAWQIPITDEITSIGIVTERGVFKTSKLDPGEWFSTQLTSTPSLMQSMQNAKRINEFKLEGDYSYQMDKFVGDGFLLIGDAARFVDPIFSSGVSLALYSAKYASQRIIRAFETGNFSETMFRPYEEKMRAGSGIWYEFIRLYYKLLPAFTYFIQNKKHRLEVLRLLQGEVFDRHEVPVLDEMRDFIFKVESTEDFPQWKKALSDIPID